MSAEELKRANFLKVPEFFELNHACLAINEAFGIGCTYLVGSCLTKRDYRDVDVRTILDDEYFQRLFPGPEDGRNALWSLTCASFSLWLGKHSGLPIDYQIQSRTYANKYFKGDRSALGIFIESDVDIKKSGGSGVRPGCS